MRSFLLGVVFLSGGCLHPPRPLPPKPPQAQVRAFERVPPAEGTLVARGAVLVALREIEHAPLWFATDSYALGARARARLTVAARTLAPHHEVEIVIVGHADERGGEKYNRGLGFRRAHAVAATLARAGIGRERLVVVSAGEERPRPSRHDPRAWAANRLVKVQLRERGLQVVDGPRV